MVLKRIDLRVTQTVANNYVETARLLQGNKTVKIVRMFGKVHLQAGQPLLDLDEFHVHIAKTSQAAVLNQVSNQCVFRWGHSQTGAPVGNIEFSFEVENLPAFRSEAIYLGFNTVSRAAGLDTAEVTIYYQEYKGGY